MVDTLSSKRSFLATKEHYLFRSSRRGNVGILPVLQDFQGMVERLGSFSSFHNPGISTVF